MKNAFKFTLLAFFLVANFQNIQAQDKHHVAAELYFKDGKVLEGIVRMPLTSRNSKVIFKENNDAEKQIFEAGKLEHLVLKGKDSETILKRTQYYQPANGKLSKKPVWLMMRMYCSNFQSYVGVLSYDINKHGELFATYVDAMGAYCIERENEKYPTNVGMVFIRKVITQKMFDKQRQKLLAKYYSNDKSMLKKLQSMKRVSQSEMTELLQAQCETDEDQ